MPVSVVVGGQFGSEGKGKVALHLARELGAWAAVRVGGTNSGHTAIDNNGRTHILRMLPTAALCPEVLCVIPAGAYIDPDVILREVAEIGLPSARLAIDPNATVVTSVLRRQEVDWQLDKEIGSTLSGTGAAVQARVRRDGSITLAKNCLELRNYIVPIRPLLREGLSQRKRVIIEGTQGYGLSLLHSCYYPKVTSRDTTAAAFVSETGLSPRDVDDIVLVLRSFPIRVPGNSGYLPNEIDWQTIEKEGAHTPPLRELTSVTRKTRRVGRFDPNIVRAAIEANLPTRIVLNHVDYIESNARNKEPLTPACAKFVVSIEHLLNRRIDDVGLGPASLISRPSFADVLEKA